MTKDGKPANGYPSFSLIRGDKKQFQKPSFKILIIRIMNRQYVLTLRKEI